MGRLAGRWVWLATHRAALWSMPPTQGGDRLAERQVDTAQRAMADAQERAWGGWQLGVRQSPAQGALCPPDRGLHGSGQQVAAEGPPAAHQCGRRHPGGPAGGHFRAGGGSRHGACVLPVGQPQRPPAPHSTHHTRRPGLAAWSQLSPEAGKAVAPWTGSCRAASLAPGLLLWAVAVCACGTLSPAPWRRARGPGVGGRPEPAGRSPLVCCSRRIAAALARASPVPGASPGAGSDRKVAPRSRPASGPSGLPRLRAASTANPSRGAA